MHKRVFGLDFLRAIAIVGVLISHSRNFVSSPYVEQLANVRGGFLGVELFFVLSGFLIGSILLSLGPRLGTFDTLLNFWFRRWLRTLPNYFLFLLVNIILAVVLVTVIPNLIPYLVFLQGLFTSPPNFYGETWSLAIEEWFYLVFPLFLFLGIKYLKSFEKAFWVATGLMVLVPTVLRIVFVVAYDVQWDAGVRIVTALRLDAIMYGVIAAYVKTKFPNIWKAHRWLYLIAGLILLAVVRHLSNTLDIDNDFFARTFLFSSASLGGALLLPFCDQWVVTRETIVTKIIRSIALWSYSLYLCNLVVVQVMLASWRWLPSRTPLMDWAYWASFYIICIIFAAIVYTLFEKPIMDLRDKIFSQKHP